MAACRAPSNSYAKKIERNGAEGSRIYDQSLRKQQEKRRAGKAEGPRSVLLHQEGQVENDTSPRSLNDKLKESDTK